MGHYLSTVNPEAAEQIGDVEHEPLPGVGEIVVYTSRQGYGRNRRTRFPALVMDHTEGDRLSLIVIFDAGDQIDETLVEAFREGLDGHYWERVEGVRPLAERIEEPAGIRGILATLDKAVFGDFDRPRISIIDIMQDFENRLRKLGQTNSELVKRVEAAEGAIAAANVGKGGGKRGK